MANWSKWIRPASVLGVALIMVLAVSVVPRIGSAQNDDPFLGVADSFAVLGGEEVTNTGPSEIHGNLGVSPGTSVTGFDLPGGPGIVHGTIHIDDEVAQQAQAGVTTAYNVLAGRAVTETLTDQDLGTLAEPLVPGVYFFESSAQLTGTLTLNAQNNPDAEFIFQIGSALTTASDSSVEIINGFGDSHCNVYWQVGSSATLGTDTDFQGNILALASITLNNGADILGRALAQTGTTSLDTNVIDSSECVTPVDDDTVSDDTVTDDTVTDDTVTDDTVTDDTVTDDTVTDDTVTDDTITDDTITDDTVTDDTVTDDTVTDDTVTDDTVTDDTVTDDTITDDTITDDTVTDDTVTDDTVTDDTVTDDTVTDDTVTDDTVPVDDTAPVDDTDDTVPVDDNGKITLPKTGTAGFLGDGFERAIAPSSLLLAAVLLLVGGGAYIQTNRHRYE